MPSQAGTFEALARELGHAMTLLKDRLGQDQARQFFAELGLAIPPSIPFPASLVSALTDTVGAVGQLPGRIVQLETAIASNDTGNILSSSIAVVEDVAKLVTSLEALGNALGAVAASLPGVQPADVAAFAGELAKRLAEYCVIVYLEGYWPRALAFLRLLGLVDYQRDPGRAADPTRPPTTRRSLRLDRLPQLLKAPPDYFIAVYKWGSPDFKAQELFDVLRAVLFSFGIPAVLEPVSQGSPLNQLHIIPVRLVPEPTATPPGLSLRLDVDLGSDLNLQVPFVGPNWALDFRFHGPLNTGVGLLFTPPGNFAFVPPGGVGFSIGLTNHPPQPIVLLSLNAGSRLQIDSFAASLGVDLAGSVGGAGFDIAGDVKGGKLIIDMKGSDGFLQKILSGVHVEAGFEVGADFSTTKGLHFHGSGSLDIQLAQHINLGPVDLTALTLSVGVKDGAFPVGLTTDIKAALGPLTASIEGIGFKVDFSLASNNHGNLGPLDAKPGFQPPKGAGLAIDAGVVVGGGYLYFDPDKGEYAGVAELSIAKFVTVKAIGLITTKNPDGSSGFSLLIIISAEFSGIQLGFGFTLNGVGGLLGLNRSAILDALRDGVRTGAVNSIMFPTNIVANAPRIISDLKAIFPPHPGTFLVGPMLKLGWGTPSLVTLSLGIIIEIPPGNIAILGLLKLVLPDEKAALIVIQVAFVGILDFDEKLLSFDASLYDSRIVFITLEGDMVVRLKWGDNAGFVLSVGGFHPLFTPPAGLHLPASIRRLALSILDYPWAKIRVDCYFAVTSNTVQFGAHLHLFFGVDGAHISGELGLDVLFQFSPFHFVALLSGSLALSVVHLDLLSISLRFSLEGTSPWRAKGTGSVSILFFSIDVDFDVTWGEHKDTSLPPIAVMPILVDEVNKQENWKALPPPTSNLLVTLRKLPPAMLILHPFGALTVSQRALPLNLTLDKVGNQKPNDVNRVDIALVTSGGMTLPLSEADDQFAIAQFQNMSDSDKLSRPSYQALKSGVTVGAAQALRSSKMTRRPIAYHVEIVDKEAKKPPSRFRRFFEIGALFNSFLAGNSASRSELSYQTKTQLEPFADKIAIRPEGHTVAGIDDNKAFDAHSTFSSEAMANDYLQRQVALNPSLSGTLHVLPNHEVSAP